MRVSFTKAQICVLISLKMRKNALKMRENNGFDIDCAIATASVIQMT
jgi:hypothetical protein